MPQLTPEQRAMRQVNKMRTSRYYKLLEGYFLWRREALLAEELESPFQIAKNRGAVEEIAKFLRHPELQAQYMETLKREEAKDTEPEPDHDERIRDQHADWRMTMGLSGGDEELI